MVCRGREWCVALGREGVVCVWCAGRGNGGVVFTTIKTLST